MEDNYHTALVGQLMASQLQPGKPESPCFCYHVGDIIYAGDCQPGGSEDLYLGEFYEPYSCYNNPILAIPGNHDSYDNHNRKEALAGFRTNFLNQTKSNPVLGRPLMDLPYYYWTLNTPLATIIGLCAISNCIDKEQQTWFDHQTNQAGREKCLIVAVHYPPYTYDSQAKGSYTEIAKAINTASAANSRSPDLVLAGHSHNYQRISVSHAVPQPSYTCVITGAGGHDLTELKETPSIPGARLEAGNASGYGALTITINAKARTITGSYFIAIPK